MKIHSYYILFIAFIFLFFMSCGGDESDSIITTEAPPSEANPLPDDPEDLVDLPELEEDEDEENAQENEDSDQDGEENEDSDQDDEEPG